ncbi:Momilactone A synthase [Morus notabilis]|uniref:Momilactone A synthase n=1 Tax=Morus notabilis TaxID=981085 RepID=W9SE65_9ROSA|nr:Momilactone A synthase [Morus notabilis]
MRSRLAGTARLYARYGAKVVIADSQDDLGSTVRDSINNLSHNDAVSFVHCDVTEESEVQNAVDFAVEKHGKLNVTFNNAGTTGTLTPTILDVNRADFNKVFDDYDPGGEGQHPVLVELRLGGPWRRAVRLQGIETHALVGLTKNLCVELGQYGIRDNRISPFGVVTPMLCKAMGMEKEAVEEVVSATVNLKEATVMAEDVAEAAVFLGSDESKYVSGMNIVIDGGYSVTNPVLRENMTKYFGN